MHKKGGLLMFKKRFITILLAASMSVTLFAGCGATQKTATVTSTTPQVLRYNLNTEPKTIDPGLTSELSGMTVVANTFEGLTALDAKDNPIPGVASKWEISTDGLKYTFHLRKDALWSDGKAVTAKDFAYAWKRALDPATASDYAYQLYYIKNGQGFNESTLADKDKTPGVKTATADDLGIKVIDDYTLEVDLEYPAQYFLSLTAFPTYMPVRQDIVEKDPKGWAAKPDTYISNGAFTLKDWKMKDEITLIKNSKYWDKNNVKLDTINMKMINQSSSALAAFKTGQLDIVEGPPSQEIPQLLKDGAAKVFPSLGTEYIMLNVDAKAQNVDAKAAKALQNPNVRKALLLAINRKEIVDNVTKGGEIPAGGFVSKGVPEDKSGKEFRSKDYYDPAGDVAQAKKLLSDAGYPDGKGFPKLTYIYNTSDSKQAVAQALQEMWSKNLGIQVTLSNSEKKVFMQTRADKNYLTSRASWVADYNDPMTFLDMWTSKSGNNDAGYSNTEYDKLIASAKQESDSVKRMQLLHNAEDILMTDVPIIPLYFYSTVACIKDYVKGLHNSPLGIDYFNKTYIDKNSK
jgi:oligopeptide transport system substrate-binding protein